MITTRVSAGNSPRKLVAIGRYLLAKRRRHELVDQPPAVVYWNAIQPDQQAKKVA